MAVAVMLALPAQVWGVGGSFIASAKGTATASFLKLAVGARAVGMGEAFTAVTDDATSLFWNPGAMTRVNGNSVSAMHASGIASTYFEYGSMVHNEPRWGAFGAGFEYLSPGTLIETDNLSGADVGTFSPRDVAVSLGYAFRAWDFSFGFAGKFIQTRIIDVDQTAAADFGVLSPTFFDDRLRFSLTGANLGGRLKFEKEPERLPLIMRLGSSLKLFDHWILAADMGFPSDNDPYLALGTEYVYALSGGLSLQGRAGFNSRTLGGVSGASGGSVGVGVAYRDLSVDYAFLPFGTIGNVHRASLTFRWGGTDKAPPLRADAPALSRKTAAPPVAPVAEPAFPPEPPATFGNPEEAFTRADHAIDAKNFEEAKKALESAAEQLSENDPRRARYFERWGNIAMQESDFPKAKNMYMEAIRLASPSGLAQPVVAEADAGLGMTLIEQKEYAYGIKFLRKSLELGPSEKTRARIQRKLDSLRKSAAP